VVPVFNLGPQVTQLLLDGPSLAAIWYFPPPHLRNQPTGDIAHRMGSITTWNDSAIQALNPTLAAAGLLPDIPIQTAYTNSTLLDVGQVFKQALSNFSSEFAQALALANGQFANMAPTTTLLTGHSFATAADKLAYVTVCGYSFTEPFGYLARIGLTRSCKSLSLQNHKLQSTIGAMTYDSLSDAMSNNLTFASLNVAGSPVEANELSMQLAMQAYQAVYRANQLSMYILNPNQSQAWPMTYFIYATLNLTNVVPDPNPLQALAEFISWTQLNNG
jgi:hypothetical protein